MANFINNRNNGGQVRRAPSQPFAVGSFLVPTGTGTYIPYALATTVTTGAFTGTFVLGETVTQTTSGATGVILVIGTQKLVLGSVTGTFDATNVVTGGTSGATATASAVAINKKIIGLTNQEVQSTDQDYSSITPINISTPVNVLDYLEIPVITGSATSVLEGTYVDVDPTDPTGVDVSAAGTQIFVYKVVNTGLIIGTISLTV